MASILNRVTWRAAGFGVDVHKLRASLASVPWFVKTALAYRSSAAPESFPLSLRLLRPSLLDRGLGADAFDAHYFHQDLWAARKIYRARPERHVDVGSRVDGFIAHLLTFMPVTVLDVRPLSSPVKGMDFVCGDASDMAPFPGESLESLSCLHALEHFGLGRYGDAIDPAAWSRALVSFVRVLRPGGRLYLSVPVGRQRLEFNAHRVFAPDTIQSALSALRLASFSAVADDRTFCENTAPERYRSANYACGMFEFVKPE
jgi:SAM-dependent methyltransferase